jgi:hypothetical protein
MENTEQSTQVQKDSREVCVVIRLTKRPSGTGSNYWFIDQRNSPSAIHNSLESAREEAGKLSARFPGEYFGVFTCSGVARCEITPVIWE